MRKNYNIREGLEILKDKEPVDELINITRRYPLFINSTIEEMLMSLGHISLRSLENKLREKRLGAKKKVSEIEKGIERIQKEKGIDELSFHKDEFKKPPRGKEFVEKVEKEDISLRKLKKRVKKIKEKKVEPEEKVEKIQTSRQRRMKVSSVKVEEKVEEKEAEKVKEKFKKETEKKVEKFKKDKDKDIDKDKEVDDYFDEMFGEEK